MSIERMAFILSFAHFDNILFNNENSYFSAVDGSIYQRHFFNKSFSDLNDEGRILFSLPSQVGGEDENEPEVQVMVASPTRVNPVPQVYVQVVSWSTILSAVQLEESSLVSVGTEH